MTLDEFIIELKHFQKHYSDHEIKVMDRWGETLNFVGIVLRIDEMNIQLIGEKK